MPTAYINIGSNTGDRHALIELAVARIVDAIEMGKSLRTLEAVSSLLRRSDFVESEPWGYDSPYPFLNLGLAIETDIPPGALLDLLLGVERSISPASHRTPSGAYTDRLIDIDLIAYGDLVVDTPRLTLPHPRMHLRDFVLRPMTQLAPEWRHPLSGLTSAEMLDRLSRQIT